VVAVVSTFRPNAHSVTNVERIAAQSDRVIVVDDGSGPRYDAQLTALSGTGAQVIALPRNCGIAAALNAGIEAAELVGDDVVVTFDQDSNAPQGFISGLISTLDDALGAGLKVAIVAPESFAGVSQVGRHLDHGFVEALRPIQSGMLVRASALQQIGRFEESYFIDLVDVEYYLRAREAGLVSVAVQGLDLPHELGHFQAMRVLGRRVSTTLSTPFRYYYRARNRWALNSRYGKSAASFLRRETVRDIAYFVLVVAFARPRLSILQVVKRGVTDARRGRMGRIPDDVEALASSISWRGEAVEQPGRG
jgi:rhamnosyltransferase